MSQSTPLKYLASINPVKSETTLQATDLVSFVPMDAVSENGGLRTDEERELDDVYTGYTYFAEGDIVVAKITPCFENGKASIATGLTNGTGFGTTELHVLRPDSVNREYLFYLICSDRFRKVGESMMYGAGGQKRLPEQFIADYEVPVTDLPTQRAIARYLDARTARIDALIARKQRLLELLAERRAALITRAVTRGLDPAAPTYDSGVDWLGEIPVGWEVKRLKHLVDLKSGSTITSSEMQDTGIFKVYGGNGLRGYYDNYTHEGDHVLIGRQGHLCGNINYATGQFWASEHAVVCNPLTSYPTFWLGELLRTMNLNQYSVSAAQPGLAVERIKELVVPVPPLDQAREIASLVKTKISGFTTTELTITTSIHHLQEYRSALITAAVNGEVELPQPD